MRKYELMYIVNPSLDDATRGALIENLHGILTNNGATLVSVDEWGLRDLAYEIKDLTKGYYVVTTFTSAEEAALNEFDRLARINKDVVRHMIVRLDEQN
ncbi:30S ribosomal protein S6 [Erysipelothrix larvae]|uniref:Small ribosomal subunit protein bS6 n=1 Tax=Erysipelothrix larvae TaxID=1514105 RepID=A0A109UHN0_9FIRM|nr:30S ribosomal protein S6 [Erysipelothrix larvae]AMC94471.1 30S ribosomal protein S6 [Erysipelothrix larvae]